MILAIAKGHPENTPLYKKACKELGIKFVEFDVQTADWQTKMGKIKCDAFLWQPSTPEGKADYIFEKAYFAEYILKKPFFPTAEMSFFYQDKIRQHFLFESLGLNQAKTLVTKDKDKAEKWLKQQKYPIVLKDPYASGGIGNLKIKNFKEARTINNKIFKESYYRLDKITYWQEFLGIKKDFRIVTLGRKIVFSHRRESTDSWIHNISGSGKAIYEKAPQKVLSLLKKFINKHPWPWNALDVIITKNNQVKIIEVNPLFGAKALYAVDFDIRKKQIQEIQKIINK